LTVKVHRSNMGHMDPIDIRGHTLLCLQGFRGEGYSPDFVANMASLYRRLLLDPKIPVRVVVEPDAICAACPNLAPSGCRLRGEGSEAGMKEQDQDVMRRLSIAPGEVLSWEEILRRIAASVSPGMLTEICGDCPWLPLGYCAEGIEGLRKDLKSNLLRRVEK
jgi:hypothetical protein